MTVKDATRGPGDLKTLVGSDPGFVRVLMRTALQEVLGAEMTETLCDAEGGLIGALKYLGAVAAGGAAVVSGGTLAGAFIAAVMAGGAGAGW